MRLLTVDQLSSLLRHALSRMKTISGVEPFLRPVDPKDFPAYPDYVSCPMDLEVSLAAFVISFVFYSSRLALLAGFQHFGTLSIGRFYDNEMSFLFSTERSVGGPFRASPLVIFISFVYVAKTNMKSGIDP